MISPKPLFGQGHPGGGCLAVHQNLQFRSIDIGHYQNSSISMTKQRQGQQPM